jgi:hypothetical protein
MSLFEMTAGKRYVKVTFDDNELNVIRKACTFASASELEKLNDMAHNDLERAACTAKRACESDMAGGLASLFKPGQEILVEREDIEPVLECLRTYGPSVPKEQSKAMKSAMEKIERSCRSI